MPGAEATCALSLLFLRVVEVVGVVRVVMEHVPIDQEVCQEGAAEVLKVAGGTTKFSVLSVSPVSRHMSCAG